ncbi:MAG: bifunctional phosphoribosylaminoimidazolecarboxamide formyltransferase/IMP cyclohydrolase [Pseudobdellovibrionaceae bacterium]
MFKNILISVSDKSNLVEFIKTYADRGARVVSTGGTAKTLRDSGVKVVDISDHTGFPEMMDGRVKTLHPKVHMGLLSRAGNTEDQKILKEYGVDEFDLVVVNLYPFSDAKKKGVKGAELVEFIDIGGPSMLRAAAKNFNRLTVVCDPTDYKWIMEKGSDLSLDDRRKLAGKVFAHTSVYDSFIADTLLDETPGQEFSIGGIKVKDELRYGENPHQKAIWYQNPTAPSGLHAAKILQGKALSYNNILDLEAASELVRSFKEPAVVAVKHNNPCGVAVGDVIEQALDRALTADPVSVFGGIVALNKPVTEACAKQLTGLFLECVVAPNFQSEAVALFAKKKNLRILEWPEMLSTRKTWDVKAITGGFLVQSADSFENWISDWKIIGQTPTTEIQKDLELAWKVVTSLKSNAIAIAGQGQTLGLGMGQVNRVEAVGHAIERMQKHFEGRLSSFSPVLASDAFFPFKDSVELAAKNGVKWIIQPGGSINDEEVLQAASENGVTLVLTGTRHFRH